MSAYRARLANVRVWANLLGIDGTDDEEPGTPAPPEVAGISFCYGVCAQKQDLSATHGPTATG